MGFAALVIGIVIAVIMLVAVAVPITKSTVTTANLTGTDLTIANNFVTFLLIGGLVLISGLALYGLSRK
jgi:hypothetical protein